MASGNFITQAIEIVKQAIDADQKGEYENALGYYKKSLDYFMAGLKYEKNPATKATIQARVEGYMKRAEDLKEVVEKERAAAQNRGRKGGGEGGTATRQPGEDEKEEEDKNKLKGALSSSIVTDKPNVRWEDVAGLEAAKEALKEA
ncbi:hypothetical protein NSK_008345, partial [Nannochloropsis salina CCMP1776]